MMRSQLQPNEAKLEIVGSTRFGRYPKISTEETYNMIISDGFLVDYAGYSALLELVAGGVGRAAYTSTAANFIVAVVSEKVFIIIPGLSSQQVGSLLTATGDVFIAENNNKEIAILLALGKHQEELLLCRLDSLNQDILLFKMDD